MGENLVQIKLTAYTWPRSADAAWRGQGRSCSGSIRAYFAYAASALPRGCGRLGTVAVDVLRALGAVHQQQNEGGGDFGDAVAHQHLAGLAVHGELRNSHVQSHQHRVVSGLNAVHPVAGGEDQALAVALIEFTAGGSDVQHELFHQTAPPFSSASLSAAFLRASSRVPTLKKAHSGRSSH